MSTSQEMKTREAGEMQGRAASTVYLRPAVDVYEDDKGLTLVADLPGVTRDRLDIEVDGHTLTIEGEAAIDMPEDMDALYADVNSTHFRRQFTLGKELETDQISAEMKDGVLTLHLPRRAELRPRKIEVSAA